LAFDTQHTSVTNHQTQAAFPAFRTFNVQDWDVLTAAGHIRARVLTRDAGVDSRFARRMASPLAGSIRTDGV
jgi:hypothetical protein